MNEIEQEQVFAQIEARYKQALKDHGAVDMLAARDFIGYVGKDADGWFCDIYSWGVHKGKIRGESREVVEARAYDIYGAEL